MRWLLRFFILVQVVSGLDYERGYPRIVDGDTVVLNGKNIRLQGIDAPETRQTCKDRYE
jgi:endonuclease YncB( thermonuclease family)